MFSSNTSSAAGDANFVEDVFSTTLYSGTGAAQTITNGVDLSGKGGLVWIKSRTDAQNHRLVDTIRGATKSIRSSQALTEQTEVSGLTSFSSTGFSLGSDIAYNQASPSTFASWTFREQPKFFDVVTYTGTGSNRTIAHNLGSVPGCIIVKRTDTTADWQVYHGSLANTQYIVLNSTAAAATGATRWNSTTPTSTVFSLGTDTTVNASGGTYVAYIYAHDAGGFGLTGTDNVISCGSFTTDGSGNATVSLGYEPQWIMTKCASDPGFGTNWSMLDIMRGWTASAGLGNVQANLIPNLSNAESNNNQFQPNATGFTVTGSFASSTIIYIAIRRGPMKVPTTGTSVFSPLALNNSTGTVNTTGFPVDLQIQGYRPGGLGVEQTVVDRLRGASSTSTESGVRLITSATSSELAVSGLARLWSNTGFSTSASWDAQSMVYWNFQRAPGFFDEVCYTGTGSATTVTHNLAAVPELIIVKNRDTGGLGWAVYSSATGATKNLILETTAAATTSVAYWNNTAPTASVFTVGNQSYVNQNALTYVAYLFATCPGVSKVGSYTGTGTTLQINCGFTGGARFVLIKRTDSTGDWYVWDTARGIVAGNDPYLLLNSTAAEVTSTDYVDTFSSGFEISSTAPAAINASGGTFIFLAIA
jgi:hypothetical protein